MDKRVEVAYDIIKTEFKGKLNLSILADRVKLSPFHFHRLFKDGLGESPGECLRRTRLEHAAHLLFAFPKMTISQVALDSGYASLAPFSRAFANHFGTAPKKFLTERPRYLSKLKLSRDDLKVSVVHLEAMNIIYSRVVSGESISTKMDAVSSICTFNDVEIKNDEAMCIHFHHGGKEPFDFYAGFPLIDSPDEEYLERIFKVPAGYYASFWSDIPYGQLWDLFTRWKEEWLDSGPYEIAHFFALETHSKLPSEQSMPVQRQFFIPVKKS